MDVTPESSFLTPPRPALGGYRGLFASGGSFGWVRRYSEGSYGFGVASPVGRLVQMSGDVTPVRRGET